MPPRDGFEPADTLAQAADSLASTIPGLTRGIRLTQPPEVPPVPLGEQSTGLSWVLTATLLLIVVACLRYRRNSRFFGVMLHDVLEVRERHNAFDDTLRETSFLWLLNLLWCGAAGVLLYSFINPAGSLAGGAGMAAPLGVCIGMAGAYTLFLTMAYPAVGALFSDGGKASLWLRGFLATQGLAAVALLPGAMLTLCLPGSTGAMLLAGAIIFILAKLLFIYKGFCIFFTEIASWVLFLYYLCSLEIIPVVLTYSGARYFCSMV